MNIKLSLSHAEIVEAIQRYVSERSGVSVETAALQILVKSKQNYRSQWEPADIQAGVELRVGKEE